jgi:DNA-binding response OmpR family regulator
MAVMLLLVEDDDGIAAPLERTLVREGYDVRRVATGADALEQIRTEPPGIVILDLGLPDIDGLEVCRQARDAGLAAPVLILTARGDELDRVVGLDSGADDYMGKPVALAELLARVRALLRRSAPTGSLPSADLPRRPPAAPRPDPPGVEAEASAVRVDVGAHRAWVGDVELQLSAKEFGVLALLVGEAGNVITRERFMDEVWDEHWYGSTKTLDVTLGRLRAKLDEQAAAVRVVAVRGVGFRLEPVDA